MEGLGEVGEEEGCGGADYYQIIKGVLVLGLWGIEASRYGPKTYNGVDTNDGRKNENMDRWSDEKKRVWENNSFSPPDSPISSTSAPTNLAAASYPSSYLFVASPATL